MLRVGAMLGLAGCATTAQNAGEACLTHPELVPTWFTDNATSPDDVPEPLAFEAERELVATVTIVRCMSSSVKVREASCELTPSEDGLELTSFARWVSPTSVLDDCHLLQVQCAAPGLPEGRWQLRYGARELSFELPSTTSDYCLLLD